MLILYACFFAPATTVALSCNTLDLRNLRSITRVEEALVRQYILILDQFVSQNTKQRANGRIKHRTVDVPLEIKRERITLGEQEWRTQ